jgi:hypothetical protein
VITVRDLVTDQLETTLLRQAWQSQPSLSEALEGLTAAQAAWRPTPARHSIWQIVRHLILWKDGLLRALDGDPPEREALQGADWGEAGGDESAWRADREAALRLSHDLLARARAMDDATLSRPLVWYRGWTKTQPVAVRLLRRAAHDSYHAGQIRYLRALQGL